MAPGSSGRWNGATQMRSSKAASAAWARSGLEEHDPGRRRRTSLPRRRCSGWPAISICPTAAPLERRASLRGAGRWNPSSWTMNGDLGTFMLYHGFALGEEGMVGKDFAAWLAVLKAFAEKPLRPRRAPRQRSAFCRSSATRPLMPSARPALFSRSVAARSEGSLQAKGTRPAAASSRRCSRRSATCAAPWPKRPGTARAPHLSADLLAEVLVEVGLLHAHGSSCASCEARDCGAL